MGDGGGWGLVPNLLNPNRKERGDKPESPLYHSDCSSKRLYRQYFPVRLGRLPPNSGLGPSRSSNSLRSDRDSTESPQSEQSYDSSSPEDVAPQRRRRSGLYNGGKVSTNSIRKVCDTLKSASRDRLRVSPTGPWEGCKQMANMAQSLIS